MADWSKPTTSDTYTNVLTYIDARLDELAIQFAGASPTNLPTNAIRWNSSTNKWEKYNGSIWVDLTTSYAVTVSNATTVDSKAPDTAATANKIPVRDAAGGIDLPTGDPASNYKAAHKKYIDDKVAAGVFPSGTKMIFAQAAAPTGWTKVTTHNDKALRVVSGTGGGSGGTLGLSAATVGSTTLTSSHIPAHTHTANHSHVINTYIDTADPGGVTGNVLLKSVRSYPYSEEAATYYGELSTTAVETATVTSSSYGSGTGHDHTLALAYVDVIIASKD